MMPQLFKLNCSSNAHWRKCLQSHRQYISAYTSKDQQKIFNCCDYMQHSQYCITSNQAICHTNSNIGLECARTTDNHTVWQRFCEWTWDTSLHTILLTQITIQQLLHTFIIFWQLFPFSAEMLKFPNSMEEQDPAVGIYKNVIINFL